MKSFYVLRLDPSQDIFSELPIRLKYEFLVALYKELILDCPFFNSFDMSFVVKIVPLLKPVKYKAGEYLWEEGEHSSSSKLRFNFIKSYFW